MHCSLRITKPRQYFPALLRHHAKVDVAEPTIAFLLLIHYFVLWPWSLTCEHLQCIVCDALKLCDKFEHNRAITGRVIVISIFDLMTLNATYSWVNSALHPFGVAKSNTSFGWGKGGNVTSAGWQVTLCDPIWHVSSRNNNNNLICKAPECQKTSVALAGQEQRWWQACLQTAIPVFIFFYVTCSAWLWDNFHQVWF